MMPEQRDGIAAWGINLEAAICEHCDWRYLLPQGLLPLQCPHCFQATLIALDEQDDDLPHSPPPELVLPFSVSTEVLGQKIQRFSEGMWFTPTDLKAQNLKTRLQRIYLPMWLVDSQVQATWQAEVGFNYEAVSHRDSFNDKRGGWQSQQITETRIRWEPRVGRLRRIYHNITAPALEEHFKLADRLGRYDLDASQAYQPDFMDQALVRLPNRAPEDAWPDAVPALKATASEECCRATNANHMRQFRWSEEYHNQNWTLMLLPMYITYYLDDDQNPQPVLIQGQTGQLSGSKRPSMKRARRAALIIVAVAVVIFALSLVIGLASLYFRSLLPVAGVGMIIALLVGILAITPMVMVWLARD